jgi:putative ABC transport system ATP-binding protein
MISQIAGALADMPKLVLADEPAGNLDSQTADTITELLRTLAHSQDTTVLVVTHDEAIANSSDRTLRLADGRLHEEDAAAK